jgi:hypothetical protein
VPIVIMLVLGAIFLIVGVAMLGLGFLVPTPGGGMEALLGLGITGFVFVVIGVIFIPIGVYMLRSQARDRRIRTEGIAGTATIVDIGETNMTINDRPVLNLSLHVAVPGRPPYAVEKRITMPWNALGRLAVGATVPVKVDRTDPEDVVIEWTAAPAFGMTVGLPTAGPPPPPGPMGAPGANQLGTPVPNQLAPPGVMAAQSTGPPVAGGEALLQYLRSMGVDINGPMAAMIASAGSMQHQIPGAIPHAPPIPRAPLTPGSAAGAPVPWQAPAPPDASARPLDASAGPLDVRADEAELLRSGVPGRATIRGAEDLGVGAQGKRLVRLELEVTPTGRAAYPLQHVTMAPESSMPRLAKGTSLAVHVDAENPQNLAIDWDGA